MLTLNSVRGLNLAQHWLTQGAEEKDQHKIRAMMTGPLATTVPPKPVELVNGRPKIPTPWWWGDDNDASASSMRAAQQLRKR